ncbi:putative T7SS-secreted protein [Nocardioides campestrisoli]|uniref:putative T7SS-secreted protein n=1 Tax=Nocardioides campestrisoli TaxID=2736757 RepID=UPI0015E6D77E|nr:hypothetical protein [Nocardioides campestrisoli]
MTAPASKELGQTDDHRELVPGDVSAVRAVVTRLTQLHTTTDGAFDDFGAARVPAWTGFAAAAYESAHEEERERWKLYLKLLDTSAKALEVYAGHLEAAQGKAAEALAKWEEGEAKRIAAYDAWEKTRQTWNAAVAEGRPLDEMPPHPGAFPSDPGAALRNEAEELLETARDELEAAGETATVALGREDGSRTEGESGWFGAEGSASGPSFNWGPLSEAFGSDPREVGGGRSWDDFALTLGEAEGAAWMYRATGTWEDYWGDVRMNADGTFRFLEASGRAGAGLDSDGARADLGGKLTVVGVDGQVGGEYGVVEGNVSGEAEVAASADGKALFGRNGAHASGELFAGARAGVDGSIDVGGFGGKAGVEGWAGAGVGAEFNVGYESGRFTIGGSGGIAWGVGGKVSGEVILDFPKMYETGREIVEGIGGWFP